MQFKELDVVRLISSLPDKRVDHAIGAASDPQIGDMGTVVIVHAVPSRQQPAFLVECVGPEGETHWLANVLQSELELVSSGRPGGT
ncbi:DUF4926 domain-containing protein [Xanthomonas campestris]|nr:DUF4926 domain-containing protein [Xanthomonas campestris]